MSEATNVVNIAPSARPRIKYRELAKVHAAALADHQEQIEQARSIVELIVEHIDAEAGNFRDTDSMVRVGYALTTVKTLLRKVNCDDSVGLSLLGQKLLKEQADE